MANSHYLHTPDEVINRARWQTEEISEMYICARLYRLIDDIERKINSQLVGSIVVLTRAGDVLEIAKAFE